MRGPAPLRGLGALVVVLACLVTAPRGAATEAISFSGGGGSPVSIVVRSAPIAEVFEMLARKESVNVLVASGVDAEISVNLFDVSLDEAIRAIAEAAGYLAEQRGRIWVILDREDAGAESAQGNTVIRAFKIEYSEPDLVLPIVENHLSRYGEATILGPRRLLVVEDRPDFVARIEKLLAQIDRDPHQVLIESRILEITLDENDTVGIDWSALLDVDDGAARFGTRDLAVPGSAGLFFDLLTSDYEIALTALSDKGRVRTLSTPRLLTLENEEAEVVIGDRLGFRVTTTVNEVTTESVEFLESGVILRVTPSVDRQGRIVLEIHPEVSTGSISDGLPSQTTTEVTTKLVTEAGEPVFIAGLIKDRETDNRTGVPVLMNIPILGRLFARTETISINTETVVILTAHLIENPSLELAPADRIFDFESQLDENRERRRGNFGPRGPGPAGEPDLGDLSD